MAKRSDPGRAVPISADDFKYTLDEFLAYGHDDRGQSVRIVNRITPQMERDIEVLMQCRRFPYKTSGDLVRHGIIRHLEWLHRLEPDIPKHFLAAIQAVSEIIRDAEMLSTMQQTFTRLDTLIESLTASGDTAESMRLLSQARGQLSKVPDSRWKREFSERFARKYAHTGPVPVATTTGAGPEGGTLLAFPGTSSSLSSRNSGEADGPGDSGNTLEGELNENTTEMD